MLWVDVKCANIDVQTFTAECRWARGVGVVEHDLSFSDWSTVLTRENERYLRLYALVHEPIV